MNSTSSSARARISTVAPIESASRGGVASDVENSALGMFIIHLSNFRQKIDRVLSAGLVARVQAARPVARRASLAAPQLGQSRIVRTRDDSRRAAPRQAANPA